MTKENEDDDSVCGDNNSNYDEDGVEIKQRTKKEVVDQSQNEIESELFLIEGVVGCWRRFEALR